MIKHIIFDLDGVLVDAREMHYAALNMALVAFDQPIISKRDHLDKYDGLSTDTKLVMLDVPEELHGKIWALKQEHTTLMIQRMVPDDRVIQVVSRLKEFDYTIHVASNSIKKNIRHMLDKTGLLSLVDVIFSNEMVENIKPNPEIYLQSMIRAEVGPRETLIVEDSIVGRKGALASGAYLHAVRNPDDLSIKRILEDIIKIDNENEKFRTKWQGGEMNVLIPMAGEGQRFINAGYYIGAKPLIDISNEKNMIETVIDNININARHIFIVQENEYNWEVGSKYNHLFYNKLKDQELSCTHISIEKVTEGAACTTLLAKDLINNDEPLLIANCDQFIEDFDVHKFMYAMIADDIDAGIITHTATDPKWSFARLNSEGLVDKVAEKDPISDLATVGIYYWRRGSDYVKYAEQMIAKNIRTNGEFYVCPVFNEAIADGKKVKTYHVDKMWGLGTPEDLELFLEYSKDKNLK